MGTTSQHFRWNSGKSGYVVNLVTKLQGVDRNYRHLEAHHEGLAIYCKGWSFRNDTLHWLALEKWTKSMKNPWTSPISSHVPSHLMDEFHGFCPWKVRIFFQPTFATGWSQPPRALLETCESVVLPGAWRVTRFMASMEVQSLSQPPKKSGIYPAVIKHGLLEEQIYI